MRNGWTRARLEQIAEVTIGRQLSPSKRLGVRPRRYLRAANVTAAGIGLTDVLEMDFTPSEEAALSLRPGDVIVVEGGNEKSVGCPALVSASEAVLCFQNTLVRLRLRPGAACTPEYLLLAWRGLFEGGSFASLATGTTILHLGARRAARVEITLPPLAEQRRIVDLVGAADDAMRGGSVARHVELAWRALLADVATEASEWTPLSVVVTAARAGATPLRADGDYFGGGVPWLKSGEVDNPHITKTAESLSARGLRESSAWLMPVGTVVVAMYGQGPTAGNVGFLEVPMASNQAVLGLVPDAGRVHPRFLFHWLRGSKESMRSRRSGSTQPNLNKELVLREQVPVLDLGRQRVLSEAFDALLDVAWAARRRDAALASARGALLADLLSGEPEIPASYDRFLDGAA